MVQKQQPQDSSIFEKVGSLVISVVIAGAVGALITWGSMRTTVAQNRKSAEELQKVVNIHGTDIAVLKNNMVWVQRTYAEISKKLDELKKERRHAHRD